MWTKSVRRSAWFLGAVVLSIYLGYIAWNLLVVAR
jgi:hypothetical protein